MQGVRPLLEAIPYNTNDVYLHTDEALMPRRRPTWSSWNFLGSSDPAADEAAVCVTYWLNNLQRLPADAQETFVTLNPPRPPAADKTVRHLWLAHPVYSFASYEAQQKLSSVQASTLLRLRTDSKWQSWFKVPQKEFNWGVDIHCFAGLCKY